MGRAQLRPSGFTVAVGLVAAGVVLLSSCTTDAPVPATPTSTGSPSAAPVADGEDLTPDTAITALVVTPTTTPAPVLATDGRVHLAYELLLSNASPADYEMSSFEVVDADSGETLLTIGEDTIQQRITRLGATAEGVDASGPVDIGSGQTWIAWMDVAVDPDAVPSRLEHRSAGALQAASGPREADYMLGATPVSGDTAQIVSSPVAPGDWFVSEGCCLEYTHHRYGFAPINGTGLTPQRFAVDLFKVDESGRTWEGDPSELSSYFSYRQPILAAASGTVVRAVDRFANTTALPEPPTIPPILETVGNHVVVQIGPGRYLLYAHMDPGSVRVRVGDEVEAGQELGLIGSSGNSTTPHLHFQLQTEPTFFPTDSVPYVFDRFTLLGSVPDRIWDDDLALQPTGELPFDEVDPSDRTDELPLDRSVIRLE